VTSLLIYQNPLTVGICKAQIHVLNIDEWLDPDSAQFDQTLHDTVFHYSPQAMRGERFEVCIATPEMREAAWKYGHQSQIILDGTFGVFLLFSAPSGNRHTAAGYNTEIIARLIDEWTKSLGA